MNSVILSTSFLIYFFQFFTWKHTFKLCKSLLWIMMVRNVFFIKFLLFYKWAGRNKKQRSAFLLDTF